jgi:3-hydroxyacyl-CoA dehydrogenase / enoyl-CoA hydratase / 3-hydroxybutyryl-CoA epimerase / enoyl-CoA isomerase
MIFEGKTLRVAVDDDGIAELTFDATQSSVNKFDAQTLSELREAVDLLRSTPGIRGVMLTSARDTFIVGADINRFTSLFSGPVAQFEQEMRATHRLFADIEDLPFPSVAVIGGMALGGGFEVCLACDFRVMATGARVGLPEINLGIFPGWGGSIRLPRLMGVEAALEWIADGRPRDANAALACGVVDEVAEPAALKDVARNVLHKASDDEIAARRQMRTWPGGESVAVIEDICARYRDQIDSNYPALGIVLETISEHIGLGREDAMTIEIAAFIKVARTPTAASLVGLFLNDQVLKKQMKRHAGVVAPVRHVGIVGAGIMGGGIALQCALSGLEVTLFDAARAALDKAMEGIRRQLQGGVDKGRLDVSQVDAVIARIYVAHDMAALASCDLLIEAVVEDHAVKAEVLADVDSRVSTDAVIASNTSTILIDTLAVSVHEPSRFLGLHFFNPVPAMPLVEVIRGTATDDATVSRAVAFTGAIGKHPVVVRDCPGFLVNRVLFPYLNAFDLLIRDGVDFEHIDHLMESFGWPMGPAYLIDVVGIDTTVKAGRIMAEGFPDRMKPEFVTATQHLFEAGRLGVKNGAGYYRYEGAPGSRPNRASDAATHDLLAPCINSARAVTDGDVIARMMVPMSIELVRCLDEGIVDSPEAADMALIRGIGFPRHIGGALRYIDRLGAAEFCALADRHGELGAAYQVPQSLRAMAQSGKRFFEHAARAN